MPPPKTAGKAQPVEAEESRYQARADGKQRMNPRNSFDAFGVGPTNQFAQAACKAVSDARQDLQSAGSFTGDGAREDASHAFHRPAILGKKKAAKVVYITSEAFTNEFIERDQNNTLIKFRKRYGRRTFCSSMTSSFRGQGPDAGGILPHVQYALRWAQTDCAPSERPPSEIAARDAARFAFRRA